ncbi:MAG: Abi family protein [Defluviitaleaceae bacterium]|nr:Abi family protein [Defluviitaleaceae bacterium]
MKTHQPSLTVDEQIENLQSKGLIIDDLDYAKSILSDISYFRLIKAYSLGLKEYNGNYYNHVRFKDIVGLYLFDSQFRYLLFPQIEKIEINLRCRISNCFSDKYGVIGYNEKNNFSKSTSKDLHPAFFEEIENEIKRNNRKPFIKNFQQNYEDAAIPMYALVEVMSFGMLSKFYKNMKNEDKKEISALYETSFTYLQSWFENLSYVRNICAHYGRLYNAKMTKKPCLYKIYTNAEIPNDRIFATLLCIKHLLPNDHQWKVLVENIYALIEKYPNIKLAYIGFPQNWMKLLLD